jgi:tetratricopeptide (TPR) repeat protein
LQVRIGIATGLVVVGDLIGSGGSLERGVVGETPNLAARLQALAEPGCVVLDENTQRLLRNLFKLQALGAVHLKGIPKPVLAYVALRKNSIESRFEARHASETAPLVGRTAEIQSLLQRWECAKQGKGQVVLLSGEPGIGKSRLTGTLIERVSPEAHVFLRYHCSPHDAHSALFPFVQRMEHAAGFEPNDSIGSKLTKLAALLEGTSTSAEDKSIFAEFLSLQPGDHFPRLDLSPSERRRRTFEAILARIETFAAQLPLLIVFEDVHWIDPSSLDLLDRMIDRVRDLPAQLVVTFRPEFAPRWTDRSHVGLLVLNRLDQDRSRDLVLQALDGSSLSSEVVEEIVARTDGVPLFLEELVRSIIESASEEAVHRQISATPVARLAVPATLHGSLMARLDRLEGAKEVAQISAAIGREFTYDLLFSVASLGEAELQASLNRLVEAGLLLRGGGVSNARFSFKHSLLQDAAYGTMLLRQRRRLHARIAKSLRDKFHDTRGTQPEIVAFHYMEADLKEEAIEWWFRAGERGLQRSNYKEAILSIEQALALSNALPQESERRKLLGRLNRMHGQALFHVKGQAAPETVAAFSRARELLSEQADNERFSIYWGTWVASFARAELDPMRQISESFLMDSVLQPQSAEANVAHRLYGVTRWFEGDYVGALPHLEKAVREYQELWGDEIEARFAYRADIVAKCCLAFVLWPMGELERASSLMEDALASASQNGHVPTIAITHTYALVFDTLRRNFDRTAILAERLISMSRESELPLFLAAGMIYLGWSQWRAGEHAGRTLLVEGLAKARDIGFCSYGPHNQTLLAELEAAAGEDKIALARLDEQLETIDRTGERWTAAEVHRLRGEILLRSGSSDREAEQALEAAVTTARDQQTRTFEFRASLSLAKLYRRTGRDELARDLLSSMVAFNEAGAY